MKVNTFPMTIAVLTISVSVMQPQISHSEFADEVDRVIQCETSVHSQTKLKAHFDRNIYKIVDENPIVVARSFLGISETNG